MGDRIGRIAPAFRLVLLISVFCSAIFCIPAVCDSTSAQIPPEQQALLIKNNINYRLERIRLYDPAKDAPKIEVAPLSDTSFAIRISGEVSSSDVLKNTLTAIDEITRSDKTIKLILKDGLKVKKAPEPEQPLVRESWPLSYLCGGIGSLQTGTTKLVEAMNSAYGEKDKPVVFADTNDLWLMGSLQRVLEMKSSLAAVSGPWPQVQLEMWAIQLSGTEREISQNAALIRDDIDYATNRMTAVRMTLGDVIQADPERFTTDEIFEQNNSENDISEETITLGDVGYCRKSNSTLSLLDSLIFFGLSSHRKAILDDLTRLCTHQLLSQAAQLENKRTRLQRHISNLRDDIDPAPQSISVQATDDVNQLDLAQSRSELNRVQSRLAAIKHEIAGPMFPRLRALIGLNEPYGRALIGKEIKTIEADRNGTRQFIWDAYDYQQMMEVLKTRQLNPDQLQKLDRERVPERLIDSGSMVDGMLKGIVEAYNNDLKTMFLDPLLARVESRHPSSASGVSLAGKAHIVVTSGMQSVVEPKMVSYADNTKPAPINAADLLGTALPAKVSREAGKTETTTEFKDLSGLSGLLAQLPQAKAIQLAAALTSDVQPTYVQLAPGIQITVTPVVLPGAGSAHLSLDASFGVETQEIGNKDTKNAWSQAPPSAIKVHHTKTEAVIDGSALFDLSSFVMTTTTPNSHYIPVLGRLPIIGSVFQFPHSPKEIHQESIVLVNAAMIPRSLGLLQLYSAPVRDASVPINRRTSVEATILP